MMIAVLGIACVAWTSFELIRLWNAGLAPIRVADEATSTPRYARSVRFAAWDERGRPIVVDDFGRR